MSNFEAAKQLFFEGLDLLAAYDYGAAEARFLASLSFVPDRASTLANLSSAQLKLKKYDEAVASAERALSLNDGLAEAWLNLGLIQHELGSYKKALFFFDKATERQPDYYDGYWNKALAQLVEGDFENGWRNYEFRWRMTNADPVFQSTAPRLAGIENIHGKSILVWHEQGFGDTIQFARYVPLLVQRGARVTFVTPPSLHSLFARQFDCVVVSRDVPRDDFDFQIPLLSLPLLFETDANSIPAAVPYISIPPQEVSEWKRVLPLSEGRLNIGIACSGSLSFDLQHGNNRPAPLAVFAPLMDIANLFLIQKDIRDEDRAFLERNPGITLTGSAIEDFEDSGAIVECMDMIISVDTSLAHLAGALGKKVYVLLQYSPDWRWLLDRDDSPWYPTATLIRQPTMGDWSAVMAQVEEEVRRFIPG
ncbi:tetratricopeptide repeat protein [Uliginosibacterium sp. H3]|uniref:Tetratricopeptide repeat protein n=1 Tax=Uliginosibacterium silvisoli TaxID=3114758 RepID=A0ABU6K351_9RHOO|nr:tetratricopeptide repeat protein [Uliginosibacterium sp. H3]